jgi:5-(aminomethyl)-3-furanmethanol phosphate kinase
MIDSISGAGAAARGIVVFKIGGSLHEHPQLRSWLQTISMYGAGRALIVPGGGPFAEQIRRAQARWGFDDRSAHQMALQAMDQYGRLLAALEPRLTVASLAPQLRGQLSRGAAVLLTPSALLADETSIEPSWDVTADTLALWVAQRFGAAALVLVKSVAPAAGRYDAAMLAGRGIVDRAFAAHLARQPLPVWWLGPDNPAAARHLLEGGRATAEIAAGEA